MVGEERKGKGKGCEICGSENCWSPLQGPRMGKEETVQLFVRGEEGLEWDAMRC